MHSVVKIWATGNPGESGGGPTQPFASETVGAAFDLLPVAWFLADVCATGVWKTNDRRRGPLSADFSHWEMWPTLPICLILSRDLIARTLASSLIRKIRVH